MDAEECSSGTMAASSLLLQLPSQGYFTSVQPSATLGGMRVYVCDHETTPLAGQIITTDQTNILIRSLTMKSSNKEKPKVVKEATDIQTDQTSKRRRSGEGLVAAKKVKKEETKEEPRKAKEKSMKEKEELKNAKEEEKEATKAKKSEKKKGAESSSGAVDFEGYTVKELKVFLQEKGLSQKGKKDELIARLKGSSG